MRVLVTGGAGFIGSNYVRSLLNNNEIQIEELVVMDKLTYAGNLGNFSEYELNEIKFIEDDITQIDKYINEIGRIDAVVNFAAESHVDRSINDASSFVETNISGTYSLLNYALREEIEHYIQISTDEVYGSIDEGSWDEGCNLLPNSPYSASKASADLLVRSFNKTFGLNTKITRCSNNYGPNQYPEKLIPVIIRNLIKGQQFPLYGNGLNVRDWLHVSDHCRAINLVLKSGKPGEIYNIGGGKEMSNINIAKLILGYFGEPLTRIDWVEDRKGHDIRYSVNWTKIRNELGYNPLVDFKDGLIQTIEWYIENQSWWEKLSRNSIK